MQATAKHHLARAHLLIRHHYLLARESASALLRHAVGSSRPAVWKWRMTRTLDDNDRPSSRPAASTPKDETRHLVVRKRRRKRRLPAAHAINCTSHTLSRASKRGDEGVVAAAARLCKCLQCSVPNTTTRLPSLLSPRLSLEWPLPVGGGLPRRRERERKHLVDALATSGLRRPARALPQTRLRTRARP